MGDKLLSVKITSVEAGQATAFTMRLLTLNISAPSVSVMTYVVRDGGSD
jgi:hypothetical protein